MYIHGASAFMVLAVASIVAFTVYQILATVPQVVLHVTSPVKTSAATEDTYIGLVSWTNKQSLHIVDSYGKQHDFAVDSSTKAQKGNGPVLSFNEAVIHIYDRVRIVAQDQGNTETAKVIIVQ